jgi:hypothetical protein
METAHKIDLKKKKKNHFEEEYSNVVKDELTCEKEIVEYTRVKNTLYCLGIYGTSQYAILSFPFPWLPTSKFQLY